MNVKTKNWRKNVGLLAPNGNLSEVSRRIAREYPVATKEDDLLAECRQLVSEGSLRNAATAKPQTEHWTPANVGHKVVWPRKYRL